MSAVDSKGIVNSSANRVDEAWWRRKKERRGRREKKNLPKRLLQIIRSLIRRLCFSFLSPSQSRSKFLEYFSPLQNCCSFHFSAAICCRPRHNGNNGGTRKRVIVGVIFNLQPSTANSNALFSVTFGHKESLSTVINYFMGGKSISPGMGGGGRSANHGCIRA